MAKNRMVSTGFWSDNYVSNLDPVEKLLFLYLLTGEKSTLAGVYELPAKVMAVETGIDVFMVEKILRRFQEDGKIMYHAGWVSVRNFLKHHEQGSPTVKKAIEDALKAAPPWAKDFAVKGIDTLSPSASASASISATRGIIIEEESEIEVENTRTKSKPKYPHAKEVSSWFDESEPSWLLNTTQLKHMELLYLRGEEKVRAALRYCKAHKDDEHFYQVLTPYDLETKWVKIADYAKRNR